MIHHIIFVIALIVLNISMYSLFGFGGNSRLARKTASVIFVITLLVGLIFVYVDPQKYWLPFSGSWGLMGFWSLRFLLFRVIALHPEMENRSMYVAPVLFGPAFFWLLVIATSVWQCLVLFLWQG